MRAILFSNELLGLGHLRLSIVLARALTEPSERSTALIVTGSTAFAGPKLPPRVDVLRMPAAPVSNDTEWAGSRLRPPAQLAIESAQVLELRSELALSAVRTFEPDIAVVDYTPLGHGGDLRAALEFLRARGSCTIALGLRDADYLGERLRAVYAGDSLATIARLYDLALVYGGTTEEDLRVRRLSEAGLPIRTTQTLIAEPPADRSAPDLGDGYLLGTVGGGVDGFPLLDAIVGAMRRNLLAREVVLVTGPLMPASDVARLRERAQGLPVRIFETRPDIPAVIAGARAIVAMAGMSTVGEILASGKPALLVPRLEPRNDQIVRARRLAAEGRVQMLEAQVLEPSVLEPALVALLAAPGRAPTEPTGAREAANLLTAWADTGRSEPQNRHRAVVPEH